MRGPAVLLALGALLAAGGGSDPLDDFDLAASLLLAAEPQDPKCFSRLLHDLSCFWESAERPDPAPFRMEYRLEGEPWRGCPLAARPTPWATARFWCALPPSATVAFAPLELRVRRPPRGALFNRTLFLDQVVLLDAPSNVSVSPAGPGGLCVRWLPPPSPYLESSLVYEVAVTAPGTPGRTVAVGAGRTEAALAALPARTRHEVRVRARPDGVSYGGYWSAWSAPAAASTSADWDPLLVVLSCALGLLVLLLALLALLGHRRALKRRLWPAVPGPERGFEGLFSVYGGNLQLWLLQGTGPPAALPEPETPPSPLEEVTLGPPPAKGTPPAVAAPPTPPTPAPLAGPSPAPSFEYTLFDPQCALLCPPAPPRAAPYANLAPPCKGDPPTGPSLHEQAPPKGPPHPWDPPGGGGTHGTPKSPPQPWDSPPPEPLHDWDPPGRAPWFRLPPMCSAHSPGWGGDIGGVPVSPWGRCGDM